VPRRLLLFYGRRALARRWRHDATETNAVSDERLTVDEVVQVLGGLYDAEAVVVVALIKDPAGGFVHKLQVSFPLGSSASMTEIARAVREAADRVEQTSREGLTRGNVS
jgi:hypothetical protein